MFIFLEIFLQLLNAQKMKKNKIKLMVNTGQVMFSGEIYFY